MLMYCNINIHTVHGANTGPTWVLSVTDGPHVGPMNLAIRAFTLGWQHSGCLHCPDLFLCVTRHGVLHTNLSFVISMKCGFSPGLMSFIIMFYAAAENLKISRYPVGLFPANRRKLSLNKYSYLIRSHFFSRGCDSASFIISMFY